MLCFRAPASVEETATFSMFLTDWKVFFQSPLQISPWKGLSVVRPTFLASAASAAKKPVNSFCTFGPSQTKLLSIGNGKLEVARKARRERAASLPGEELMRLCKKEATVCG